MIYLYVAGSLLLGSMIGFIIGLLVARNNLKRLNDEINQGFTLINSMLKKS